MDTILWLNHYGKNILLLHVLYDAYFGITYFFVNKV